MRIKLWKFVLYIEYRDNVPYIGFFNGKKHIPFKFYNNFFIKVYGKMLAKKSPYIKSALHYLDRSESDGRFICPDCGEYIFNECEFLDHMEIHGYPRDMDTMKFYEMHPDILIRTQEGQIKLSMVKKANPEYLKYL